MTNDNLVVQEVDGYLIPKYGFRAEHVHQLRNFVFRPGDVFLISYPKCGSTWTKYIIWEIISDEALPPSELDACEVRKFPFLELTGIDIAETIPDPRAMKLHAPYRITPIDPSAKYIYVIRNPFDCCVSLYHHVKDMEDIFHAQNLEFNEFFEFFMKGQVPFGDYFEHVRSWYEHRNDPNLMLVYYEDMKKNPKEWLMKIAAFIGPEYEQRLMQDPERAEKILHFTSFEYMQKNMKVFVPVTAEGFDKVQHNHKNGVEQNVSMKQMNFIRQGQTLGGKGLLTEDQRSRLTDLLRRKLKGLDIVDKLIPTVTR